MDIQNEDIARYEELGYVVVPEVVQNRELAALLDSYSSLPRNPNRHPSVVAIEPVLVRRPEFFALLRNPRVISTVRQILGDDLQLLSFEAHELLPSPSDAVRSWHTDLGVRAGIPLTVIAAIYLVDVTEASGPLYVLPASHRADPRRFPGPRDPTPLDEEHGLKCSAGSAVFFDGNLWHGPGRNLTDVPRRALFLTFGHYWMKRQDEFYVEGLPDTIANTPVRLTRQLFGLKLYSESVHGAWYSPNDYSS